MAGHERRRLAGVASVLWIVILGLEPAWAAAPGWPMSGGDCANTGRSLFTGIHANPRIGWSSDVFSRLTRQPVVGADGAVYVGDEDGYVRAFNPDGSVRWTYTVPYNDDVVGCLALGPDGSIYAIDEDCDLYAIAGDGTQKWHFGDYRDSVGSRPPVVGPTGTVFVTNHNHFTAVTPDGACQYHIGIYDPSPPCVDARGVVYFNSDQGHLYALNPDGSEKWSYYCTDGGSNVRPSLGPDGTLYARLDDYLYAFNSDGDPQWSSFFLDVPCVGPDGTLYSLAFGTMYSSSGDGTWNVFYDAHEVWDRPTIDADGMLYFYTPATHTLNCMTPGGEMLWTLPVPEGGSSPAIGPDGSLYVRFRTGVATSQVIQIVPEPGTVMLLGLGAFGLMATAMRCLRNRPGGAVLPGGRLLAAALPLALALAWVAPAAAQPAATAWPSYGQNIRNTHRSPYVACSGSEVLWTTHWASNDIKSEIAIAPSGSLYYTSWESPGPVYTMGHDGSGASRLFETGDRTTATPLVLAEGTIVISSAIRTYCIDASGTEIWRHSSPRNYYSGSPQCVPDGTIYVPSADGLHALNPDGSLKWLNVCASDSGVAVGWDGTLYATSYEQRCVSAVTASGTTVWTVGISAEFNRPPSLASDDTVYVGCGPYGIGQPAGKVLALDPADGSVKWEFATLGHLAGGVAVGSDDTAYVGDEARFLYAIGSDGVLKWKFAAGAALVSAPTVDAAGRVLFTTNDRHFYCLDSGGQVLWDRTYGWSSQAWASPVIDADGTIFIAHSRNAVSAIVPEPAVLSILAFGGLMLPSRRRPRASSRR